MTSTERSSPILAEGATRSSTAAEPQGLRGALEPFLDDLRDPADRTPLAEVTEDRLRFRGGREYPRIDGVPVLIDESRSLFSIADVVARRPTTQEPTYRDPKRLKNFVRRRLLPSLSEDRLLDEGYRGLAAEADGRPVLVLGTGDRGEAYRTVFAGSSLVLSDVHLAFGVDAVLDGHRIPFRDELFGLVLAPQVLEHTARPWIVAAEIERVTAPSGLIRVEVPFAFPYHGRPYDFFRFTPSALRFLFPRSELRELRAAEGTAAAAATFAAQMLVDKWRGLWARRIALVAGRLLFWWVQHLDRLPTYATPQRVTAAKGFAATYRKDGRPRSDGELLADLEAFAEDHQRDRSGDPP